LQSLAARIKNPVGVGETYGVRREETLVERLKINTSRKDDSFAASGALLAESMKATERSIAGWLTRGINSAG
jgi:hypothetical protein